MKIKRGKADVELSSVTLKPAFKGLQHRKLGQQTIALALDEVYIVTEWLVQTLL